MAYLTQNKAKLFFNKNIIFSPKIEGKCDHNIDTPTAWGIGTKFLPSPLLKNYYSESGLLDGITYQDGEKIWMNTKHTDGRKLHYMTIK
jgi:hypothetical protein